jgi:tetratricopeptide repeat protein
MRRRACHHLLCFLAVYVLTLGPLLAQSGAAAAPVKHYGYSGQDKMLECIQGVFGKYVAAFPHTVLYGYPSFVQGRPPQVVNGHWEPVTARVTFPSVADLRCPGTRDGIAKFLDSDVAKLLFVPDREQPEGIRIFETEQWVYIIPAMEFSQSPYRERQRWKRIKIEPKIESVDDISEAEARALLPEILKSARTIPLVPSQALSPADLTAHGMPQRAPGADDEVEVGPYFRFYKAKLQPNAPDSVVALMEDWPSGTAGRIIYGEIRDGKYHVLWDSPLLNGHGQLNLADVNDDGWEELLWRSDTCGVRNCFPEELVIFDKEGREITRQQRCNIQPIYPFNETDGVCAISGEEVTVGDATLLAQGKHGPAEIAVKQWDLDGKDRVFKLINGTYIPFERDARGESSLTSVQDAAHLNEDGMTLMRERKYRDATEAFIEAAGLDPSNAMYANNAGFAYYKSGDYYFSIEWLGKAIQIDPKRAIAYLNRGDAFAKLDPDDSSSMARKDYEKFLELTPNSKAAPDIRKKLDALPAAP